MVSSRANFNLYSVIFIIDWDYVWNIRRGEGGDETGRDYRNPAVRKRARLCCIFFRGHLFVFIKLKHNKTVSGFSQTQQYFILFYHDADMFRSLGYHQTIFTKFILRYMQCLPIHRKKKLMVTALVHTVHADVNETSIDTNKINTEQI
jgi:hypothetical protein